MFLPLAFMVSWAILTESCCATTAPTPSNNVATTTAVRIIITISLLDAPVRYRELRRLLSNPAHGFSFPVRDKMSEAMLALVLADRDPDPLGGSRHVDVIDLVLAP